MPFIFKILHVYVHICLFMISILWGKKIEKAFHWLFKLTHSLRVPDSWVFTIPYILISTVDQGHQRFHWLFFPLAFWDKIPWLWPPCGEQQLRRRKCFEKRSLKNIPDLESEREHHVPPFPSSLGFSYWLECQNVSAEGADWYRAVFPCWNIDRLGTCYMNF